MSAIELQVGDARWAFQVPANRLVTAASRVGVAEPIEDIRGAVGNALEHPLRFEHPLRRALTPDDRVVLVVDEQLPHLGELVTGVLEYLVSAGIGPESVTLLTAPGSSAQEWINDIGDEFADVHTEVHQPADRKLLSYLATTKQGRRIYLNRTLVDTDQIIAISGRRYDPLFGYAGCESTLYPALSDEESRRLMSGPPSLRPPELESKGLRSEAAEIAWLLGSPIFIQIIESSGDGIAHVCGGLIDTSADGARLLDNCWRFSIPQHVDVVLAAISGAHSRQTFPALAQAAAAASRVVKPNGVIVILSDAEPVLGEGMERIRRCEDPSEALEMLNKMKPPDMASAFSWVSAAAQARLFLVSALRPETVEELFATPILSPGEVQRLIDQGGTCLCLPDADKSLVVIE